MIMDITREEIQCYEGEIYVSSDPRLFYYCTV